MGNEVYEWNKTGEMMDRAHAVAKFEEIKNGNAAIVATNWEDYDEELPKTGVLKIHNVDNWETYGAFISDYDDICDLFRAIEYK